VEAARIPPLLDRRGRWLIDEWWNALALIPPYGISSGIMTWDWYYTRYYQAQRTGGSPAVE
jgi:hypothetical protein